jgi:AcrR family transcriptional regulator
MAAVAERSGVHYTSLYRRWGTRDALVLDVAVNRLNAEPPIPDTGSLPADLLTYAQAVAANIARPDGLAFLRAVIATASAADAASDDRDFETGFLAGRGAQIQTMLDRAAARGEPPLHYTAVLDGIVAPIYMRHLFRVGGVDDAYLAGLVDQVLTVAAGKEQPTPAALPVPAASTSRDQADR